MKIKIKWFQEDSSSMMIALTTTTPKIRRTTLNDQAQQAKVPRFKMGRVAYCSLLCLGTIYGVPAIADPSDTHHIEVKQFDGKMVSIELIRDADGRKVGIAYPYGPQFLKTLSSLPVLKMSVSEFQQFVQDNPAPPELSAGPYATGMAIGYDDSTGATPGQCYNFTSQPSSQQRNSSFETTNSISSIAQSLNISASIKASFGQFSGNNDFSFSDSSNASLNSGAAYLNASTTFTLTNAVDPSDPLNAAGQGALMGGTFASVCGSQYMNTLLAGMSVVGRLYWTSSSSTQASKFSDTFKATVGLTSLSGAVSGAQTVSDASFSCGFDLTINGGGAYATAITTALADNTASLESCCSGNTSACGTWSGNMTTAINDNVGNFASILNNWPANGAQNLVSVWPFPEGIAGNVSNPRTTTAASTLVSGNTSDPWETGNIKPALQNYLTVLNQIKTLDKRAAHLSSAVSGAFTPSYLNLASILTGLSNGYSAEVGNTSTANTMLYNLNTCLSDETTSTNVTSQCAPIIDLYNATVRSAYDFFDMSGPVPNWPEQQNTIALQYTGFFVSDNGSSWPEDVLYIDQLPPFSQGTALEPISNHAALTGFADATWYNQGGPLNLPVGAFLPLNTGSDLSEVYSTLSNEGVYLTELAIANSIPKPGLWYGYISNTEGFSYANSVDSPLAWTAATNCKPTISQPCAIGYGIPSNVAGHPLSFSMTQIPAFFDAALGSSEGPQLNSGSVQKLATPGKGKVSLTGEYQRPDGLDLSTTQLSLDLLLYERGIGGAGGLGELAVDEKGEPMTSVSLIRRKNSTPSQAVFETRPGFKPRIRIDVKSDDQSPVLHVSVDLDKGSIIVPSACENGQETVDLGFRITLQDEVTKNARSLISRQTWECRYKKGSVSELRVLPASPQG